MNSAPGKVLRILAVDDWPEILQAYRWALEDIPAKVLTATNGPEALAQAESVALDLIILDMDLPGMDGLEICRKLKEGEHTRSVPVVFCTGNAKRAREEDIKAVGAVELILKPFSIEVLRKTIQRWVQTQTGSQPHLS